MELETFRELLSAPGQEILAQAKKLEPVEDDYLAHFTALSRSYPAKLARAALEIAILRLEAKNKFPKADQMYFTRPALEQASNWEISRYRSSRYRGLKHLVDLACSIGSDTLALAHIAPTTGLDVDALRLTMAKANLQGSGAPFMAGFTRADLRHPLPVILDGETGLFFDPARRSASKRAFSVHDYQPPLPVIQAWLPECPNLGVKISPGVRYEEIQRYPAEIEFISMHGELKEAVLWFGALKTSLRRATLLPGPYSFTPADDLLDTIPFISGAGISHRQALPITEPLDYLLEPDPAILRAGLVQALGVHLDASQLDPEIAYLTTNHPVESPFVRTWKIDAWMPFGIKRLKAALRQRQVGQVTVKKRGSPLGPEQVIRMLQLKSTHEENRAERVLVLTHLRGQPIVIICFPNG